MLKYADYTVLHFANSKASLIEKALNGDLKQISTFCHNNELVLNLKKTKTESNTVWNRYKNFEIWRATIILLRWKNFTKQLL